MHKWKILKHALTGSNNSDSSDVKDLSIHRFEGFKTAKSTKLIWRGFEYNPIITINQFDDVFSPSYVNQILSECIHKLTLIDVCNVIYNVKFIVDSTAVDDNTTNIDSHTNTDTEQSIQIKLTQLYTTNILTNYPTLKLNSLQYNNNPSPTITIDITNLSYIPLFSECNYLKHHFSYTFPCTDTGTSNAVDTVPRPEPENAFIPSTRDKQYTICTREKASSSSSSPSYRGGSGRVDIKGLLSNKLHGVDNTGNIRVSL